MMKVLQLRNWYVIFLLESKKGNLILIVNFREKWNLQIVL